jgi:hypothetical protein
MNNPLFAWMRYRWPLLISLFSHKDNILHLLGNIYEPLMSYSPTRTRSLPHILITSWTTGVRPSFHIDRNEKLHMRCIELRQRWHVAQDRHSQCRCMRASRLVNITATLWLVGNLELKIEGSARLPQFCHSPFVSSSPASHFPGRLRTLTSWRRQIG